MKVNDLIRKLTEFSPVAEIHCLVGPAKSSDIYLAVADHEQPTIFSDPIDNSVFSPDEGVVLFKVEAEGGHEARSALS